MKTKLYIALFFYITQGSLLIAADNKTDFKDVAKEITDVTVYLTSDLKESERGSLDSQADKFVGTHKSKLNSKDLSKITNLLTKISDKEGKICKTDVQKVDAVLHVAWKDKHVDEFMINGVRLYEPIKKLCYPMPKWLADALL